MKRIEDERILIEKRKINSRAFSYSYIGLWILLVYRQFVLNQEPSQYWDILVLTLGISFYVLIRNVFKGLYQTYRKKDSKKKNLLIGGIVGSIIFTLIHGIFSDYDLSNTRDLISILIAGIIFFITWIGAQYFLIRKSEKKSEEEIKE
ncbi:MAG TPA: hypothetical protein DHM42_03535 [Clostridiales bacterium]|jgi:uncharacterized BrkB/YihY/UPF0761 family membrane protein|nr:hypothetical protein [Clostridiales bacterium]